MIIPIDLNFYTLSKNRHMELMTILLEIGQGLAGLGAGAAAIGAGLGVGRIQYKEAGDEIDCTKMGVGGKVCSNCARSTQRAYLSLRVGDSLTLHLA